MSDIAIIGGGIGGLSAAIALRQDGFDVEVFEQAPALLDLGAAIALWPNAVRVLEHLNLAETVLAHAGVINEIRWLTSDDRLLNSVPIASANRPAAALHRADLQKILLQALPPEIVKLDHSYVSSRHERDSLIIRFKNSREISSQLLIGADGIHSTVREGICEPGPTVFRGYTVWRGISPVTPEGVASNVAIELQGRGKRFGIGPVGLGRTGWWAAANGDFDSHESFEDSAEAHEDLFELFSGWFAPVHQLIQSTEKILRTYASDRTSSRTWGLGRSTLLGDAIHPTTPNLGQGGCMALEDAVVLARCFKKYGLSESALRAYERIRYTRTASVTYASRMYGAIGQLELPLSTEIRARVISVLPRAVIRRAMKVVFDYDAVTVRI